MEKHLGHEMRTNCLGNELTKLRQSVATMQTGVHGNSCSNIA